MKAFWVILFFLVFSLPSWCQNTSNLVVLGSNTSFQLMVDGVLLTPQTDSIVKCIGVAPGSKKLEVIVDDTLHCKKNVLLEKGIEHWFEVKLHREKGCRILFYNTLPVLQSDTITTGRTILDFRIDAPAEDNLTAIPNNEQMEPVPNEEIMVPDSAILDSILIDVYRGRKGCPSPSDLTTTLSKLEDQPFSSRRLKMLPSLLQGKCIAVKDLSSILALFEFEDHKLQIFQQVRNQVYDLERLPNLSSHFRLKKNLTLFKSML